MTDWRDRILKEFTPGAAPLTVAADPDGVLLEPGLLEALRGKGFAILPFEDPAAFRFAYESRFRSRRDAGEADVPDVVVRTAERETVSRAAAVRRTGGVQGAGRRLRRAPRSFDPGPPAVRRAVGTASRSSSAATVGLPMHE